MTAVCHGLYELRAFEDKLPANTTPEIEALPLETLVLQAGSQHILSICLSIYVYLPCEPCLLVFGMLGARSWL